MTWPAVLVWLLIASSFFVPGPMILYVGALTGVAQTLQMIPGDMVGNANFSPGSVCSVAVIARILIHQGPNALLRAATRLEGLGFLFVFYLWCLLSAAIMPRFFERQIDVIALNVIVPWAVPLQPTSANLTQSAYITISVFSGLAGYFVSRNSLFIKHWLRAIAVTGMALIGTGIIDLIFSATGQASLLEPFRNSTHALLFDDEIAGAKRVVGLMDEASIYGASCVSTLSALVFLRPIFEDRWRKVYVPLISLGLIIMAILSTSSTAFVGIAVLGIIYCANWIRRSRSPHIIAQSGLAAEIAVAIISIIILIAILAFNQSLLDPISNLINELIFNKSTSLSYEERNMWTKTGLNAFYGTYGLGVGLGGARTSNWFVAELSNTGAIGSISLGIFIALVFFARVKRTDALGAEFATSLKYSLLPIFVLAGLSSTTPDVPGTFIMGIIVGLSQNSCTRCNLTKAEKVLARQGKNVLTGSPF